LESGAVCCFFAGLAAASYRNIFLKTLPIFWLLLSVILFCAFTGPSSHFFRGFSPFDTGLLQLSLAHRQQPQATATLSTPETSTMYRSVDTSSPGTTAPHRPAPPVALSDFIAQTTPFTEYTYLYDGPASDPEAPKAEANGQSMQTPEQDVPPVHTADTGETPAQPTEQEVPSRNDGYSAEWIATRSQLLPSRHQGKKADWIRGWSEAVVVHGTETYCCCSETLDENQGKKNKKNDIAGAVRLLRLGSSSTTKEASSVEAVNIICRNCSRPPSPPLTAVVSTTSEKMASRQSQSFGQKVTDLIKQFKRSRSANRRDAEIRELTRPNSQPRWLSAQRQAAANQQIVQKSQSMDILRGRNARAIATPSSDSDLSDSDTPPGIRAMAKSKSRLQRAAALLQRTTRPNV